MNEFLSSAGAPILVGCSGLAAIAVAQLAGRLAIARTLLPDHPNDRSSHAEVTPRSGGVAIFSGWLVAIAAIAAFSGVFGGDGFLGAAAKFALLMALVFALGFFDDVVALTARWKFLGQVAVAALFVVLFGPLQMAPAPFLGDLPLGHFAAPLTVIWIVGFMNAYNFMDGANGLAASCAAFSLFAISLAGSSLEFGFWALSAAMAGAAIVGFLPLNFPGGRLFMGDNGSQTVGFLIAATAVAAANASEGAVSFLFLPTAMAPFLFDVAFTLGHRALRRQSIARAHREHLYQLLMRSGLSHGAVTAIYLSLTALSTAAAIFMLRLSPDSQWLALLALFALFSLPAFFVFSRASREGLLASAPHEEVFDAEDDFDETFGARGAAE